MVKLTPVGKITLAVIALLLFYFLVFPALQGLLPGDKTERKREIKIVAFLKTFDGDSAKLQETLREVAEDENLSKIAKITIVNVESEPGKMEQNNVSAGEVPCFILGNEKFTGLYSLEWFRQKITAVAEEASGTSQ
ncbi:MAG: hypothetical protein NT067_05565 [Candidatus Diapherotrites archaeon]|nr:hypothetical protein [Candidatus Diapherotrites archaeon]